MPTTRGTACQPRKLRRTPPENTKWHPRAAGVGLPLTVNGGEKFEGKTVKLTSDIDLAGHAWTPIGNGSRLVSVALGNQFKGTFDGNGKTISNLNINTTQGTDYAVGLFGIVNGGMVMNLKLQKVAVDVPTSEAAAAVGHADGRRYGKRCGSAFGTRCGQARQRCHRRPYGKRRYDQRMQELCYSDRHGVRT